MACPTCDHTMQILGGMEKSEKAWWCPRCGTFKDNRGSYAVRPHLVERVRNLLNRINADLLPSLYDEAKHVVECCLRPEDRPKEIDHAHDDG